MTARSHGETLFYMHVIGRRWANQHGRGVTYDLLASQSADNPALPRRYFLCKRRAGVAVRSP